MSYSPKIPEMVKVVRRRTESGLDDDKSGIVPTAALYRGGFASRNAIAVGTKAPEDFSIVKNRMDRPRATGVPPL
ncbi:hypothetical protein GWI33_018486 [Rhynchophorus ferrugineus]|uniref:Uncharacterized protein n=1 Tax=Rhynchophorus ferrugineus TaxID=354439 RepID=A0A834HUT9_RHYFE|nr:hypothetical protein GWI33_018486 [Rhynchophorus ferrugineus]